MFSLVIYKSVAFFLPLKACLNYMQNILFNNFCTLQLSYDNMYHCIINYLGICTLK